MEHSILEQYDNYNVVFDSKGTAGALDSMPLGNGDIAASVWVENGGDLVFYLAKGDCFSETGRMLKLGRVRISLCPNPFTEESDFRQELIVKHGLVQITAGSADGAVSIRMWCDANNPVVHIEMEGKSEFDVQCIAEIWRDREIRMTEENKRSFIGVDVNTKETPKESADLILDRENCLLWCHRNETSMYREMLEHQGYQGYEERYPDPYLHLTFGVKISGEGFVGGHTRLVSKSRKKRFELFAVCHTAQTSTIEQWEEELHQISVYSSAESLQKHCEWWESFWQRSWIFISGDEKAEAVTRGYLLQRYMIACQGRATFPIRFNGGLFTMPPAEKGEDYRDWESLYFHQNTRLLYWPMLAAGDFDMLMPYFNMYLSQLPLRKEIAAQFFHCEGAYYPEQTYPYGADGTRDKMKWALEGREDYVTYHWQNALEVISMMLDYYDITEDMGFLQSHILPLAEAVIRFYIQRYSKGNKMVLSPSNALETFWNCTNPAEQIAGLLHIIPRLLDLPDLERGLRQEWENCYRMLPPLPFDAGKGKLKPAEEYGIPKNIENPELYAVFPYRLYGIGRPDLDIGIKTFYMRTNKKDGCWYQDGVHAAYLGLTDDAERNIVFGFTNQCENAKFPGFWAKGNDEVPDLDNGGQASIALQSMLIQFDGEKLQLLPSWPEKWKVDFRLYVPKIGKVQYRNT